MDDDILNRKKWWPDEDSLSSSSSTAIIAGINLPSGVSSLPFVSCLNLRKCFQSRAVQSVLKVCQSKFPSESIFIFIPLGNNQFKWTPDNRETYGLDSSPSFSRQL